MRLIDADAFDATLRGGEVRALKMHNTKLSSAIQMIRGNLRKAPTIEERKTGRWIKMSDADRNYYACSECGEDLPRHINRTHYCPTRGADMRGKTDEVN